MPEALIVGVDPGNTSAVAAVDLDGEIRRIESERELPPRDIIQIIIEEGKPVVVACDTAKMPSTVGKIASSLGASRFEPEEDLERRRKEKLGRGENSHEKDAVASAVHAYNSMQREIKKIKDFSRKNDAEIHEVAENYFSGDLSNMKHGA